MRRYAVNFRARSVFGAPPYREALGLVLESDADILRDALPNWEAAESIIAEMNRVRNMPDEFRRALFKMITSPEESEWLIERPGFSGTLPIALADFELLSGYLASKILNGSLIGQPPPAEFSGYSQPSWLAAFGAYVREECSIPVYPHAIWCQRDQALLWEWRIFADRDGILCVEQHHMDCPSVIDPLGNPSLFCPLAPRDSSVLKFLPGSEILLLKAAVEACRHFNHPSPLLPGTGSRSLQIPPLPSIDSAPAKSTHRIPLLEGSGVGAYAHDAERRLYLALDENSTDDGTKSAMFIPIAGIDELIKALFTLTSAHNPTSAADPSEMDAFLAEACK